MSINTLNVGIIATEHSGDLLGHALLTEIRKISNVAIYGIGLEKLASLGLSSPNVETHYLNVMGIIDPIRNLSKILTIRKKVIDFLLSNQIDIFIGIDAPDFNMGIHKIMHSKGIRTIQLVSPSVWAWRQNRIKKIKKYIDCTLCLFPFEKQFYDASNTQAIFVGHPFSNIEDFYQQEKSDEFIALLPGSRESELVNIFPIMLEFAQKISAKDSSKHFLIPAASVKQKNFIIDLCNKALIKFTCDVDSMRDFLVKSNIAVVTSGTATLEAACYGSSPIICYKTSRLNYAILSRLNKAPFIGLPNLILNKLAFPELIQDNLTAEKILESYHKLSFDQQKKESLTQLKSAIKGEGFSKAASYIISSK